MSISLDEPSSNSG
uniref:Uncharacterized protein n=1 Tax=Lepeophtheirus salmonis TaxID=72036 RepID=A0A0K2URZ7_LEPSM